ncbi:hypothetical protein [Streptomyces sp. H34-S4]|uniref:hypothetical protein n=1 Tax=Streptomyces sp. H34-S4 TaxID=2996463 RepID=UPI00226E0B88|nr:hypothetical protein [Streptomyces sp. H34-S4]MCY0939519.1 hypothetical protein [Streptomyces sp. H34-S4]
MRVAALEDYADQVREADLRYGDLLQIQQLTDGNADALDPLARTAADALAVAEIEAMTGQAAVAAKTFTTALDRASAAAVIALPTRASAKVPELSNAPIRTKRSFIAQIHRKTLSTTTIAALLIC